MPFLAEIRALLRFSGESVKTDEQRVTVPAKRADVRGAQLFWEPGQDFINHGTFPVCLRC